MTDDRLKPDEIRALRAGCSRAVNGHGLRPPAVLLAELASLDNEELATDTYGEGGAVTLLEDTVRDLLGKPAAAFMPSGTMAQQIALRIHADRTGRRAVAFHPTCHLEIHEDKAYERLHGLVGVPIGDPRDLFTLADLQAIREPLAAVLFELPQREIGGRLPDWDDLVEQVDFVRDHGGTVHLDGARLWETGPFYDRPLADIAGLFDSVYVSLYKGLGGLAGCLLLGEDGLIGEARAWRKRHGGTLIQLWPYAASGLAGLRLRLSRMPQYVAHAQAIAAAVRDIDGVEVCPDPPQTPLMHLHLRTTPEAVIAAARRLATEQGLWTWPGSMAADTPGVRRLELTVGDVTLEFEPAEVAAVVRQLLPVASPRA